jgi:hypothetical protein
MSQVTGSFAVVVERDPLAEAIADRILARHSDVEDLRGAKPAAHVQNNDDEGWPVGRQRRGRRVRVDLREGWGPRPRYCSKAVTVDVLIAFAAAGRVALGPGRPRGGRRRSGRPAARTWCWPGRRRSGRGRRARLADPVGTAQIMSPRPDPGRPACPRGQRSPS